MIAPVAAAVACNGNAVTLPSCCVWFGCSWPTGGWGSLEYGTTVADGAGQPLTAGQVAGGRWRPLQHFFRQVPDGADHTPNIKRIIAPNIG